MLKMFPIDMIRQILAQTLYEEHLKDDYMFGGDSQINIFSFYEQLKNQDEVDRFVEKYRDLVDQQNKTGLIGNGIIMSSDNPTITNLYSSTIIPMTWTCSMRVKLKDRDEMIITINNLISKLKGKKVDVAQLQCVDDNGKTYYQPFKVGTIGQGTNYSQTKRGDYIGDIDSDFDIDTNITDTIAPYLSNVGISINSNYYYYVDYEVTLIVIKKVNGAWVQISDEASYPYVVFPPEHVNYDKFKVSMSFDAIRCDEPRVLNGEEYCEISFGGSATIVNDSVKLGNDLMNIAIQKNKIVASSDIDLSSSTTYHLEPLELSSGANANTIISQLSSNYFKQNTHTDGLAFNLQYTFVLDESIDLLEQWFNYARYGTYGITASTISPNMIYNITETWSSWGVINKITVLGKIVESIDIENTEGDTLTLGVTFQIQGENN